MPQGILVSGGSDFHGLNDSAAALLPDIVAFGVGTETYATTVDESGGILALGTGGTDNNNAVLTTASKFAPRDGKMVLIARFKYSNVDCAVFVGWAETLDTTTPVMPAEFSGSTMTYNAGGHIGLQYDVDGTTDDFRAVMGDGSAAISDSSNGIRASATLTADRWFEAEVVLNEDGSGECWLGDSGHANSDNINKLRLIKQFRTGTFLTTTDLFYPCVMIETRSGNAYTLEVDYMFWQCGRDWRYN